MREPHVAHPQCASATQRMTTEPPSKPSVFVRLAQWCMTHRWQTFVAWVVALVAAIFIGHAVGTRDIASFRLPDTESQAAYDLLAAHAPEANGGTDQLVYVARERHAARRPGARADGAGDPSRRAATRSSPTSPIR